MPQGALNAVYALAQAATAKNEAKLFALLSGDTTGYAGPSEADLAFCAFLASHTDGDDDIDFLMRRSGLMRDKWEEPRGGQTYGELTIAKAREGGSTEGKSGRQSQATVIVNQAKASGSELFHTPEGEPYVTVTVGNHCETWPVGSKQHRDYLAAQYYAEHRASPGAQALKDATNTLAGIARYDGSEHMVSVRIAEYEGDFYLDLGDAKRRGIRITAAGWIEISSLESPVKFRRPKGMLALPIPTRNSVLGPLRDLLNPIDDDDFMLILGWLLAALRPRGPYPVLGLYGEQGSGKSTRARLIRRLVDPCMVALRSEPHDERDLAIAANNGRVIGYDNLSHIPAWFSDALCRLSTGGGFGTRTLYENDEETLFDYTRPAIFTAITEIAVRGDLLDRTLTVNLSAIQHRRTEADVEAAFLAAWPGVLGMLLDAAAEALRGIGSLHFDNLPRMADFALWVEAAAPVLGWKRGEFLAAYERNRAKSNDLAMEAMPIASVLCSFLERVPSGKWEGTASQLLDVLNTNAEPGIVTDKGWPKRAHILSGQIKRLAPNLRKVGVDIEVGIRTSGGAQRLIRIQRIAGATA